MLLHQPMLLHSFEGRIQQLLPNSRELSMSSAKTVADILAFAELIDPKSFIGNPFTSQPMYIAACAFLMESVAHTSSQPSSHTASPPREGSNPFHKNKSKQRFDPASLDSKTISKHTLLATAANQNYQRCYKALQQLQTYWAGTKYILTALDQKAKGIWDPETYTSEEMESTRISRSELSQDWKRKLPGALTIRSPSMRGVRIGYSPRDHPGSPMIDPSQAIGWSLTGTTNSPSSNLTLLYQSLNGEPQPSTPSSLPGNMIYDPIRQSLPESGQPTTSTTSAYAGSNISYNHHIDHSQIPRSSGYQFSSNSQMPPPTTNSMSNISPNTSTSVSDADLLLGLQQNSAFSQQRVHPHSQASSTSYTQAPNMITHSPTHSRPTLVSTSSHSSATGGTNTYDFAINLDMNSYGYHSGPGMSGGLGGVGDMMIESQEIDMSTLGNEMMPWLEYLPQDVLGWVDHNGHGSGNTNVSVNNGNARGDGNVNVASAQKHGWQ